MWLCVGMVRKKRERRWVGREKGREDGQVKNEGGTNEREAGRSTLFN